ncbi:hypothetical protein EDB86DRAFT_3126281 [Lactarius hatsudake]|nr:hypothetical protein EDB86DRAFT_3126281 [Lactarius hatsudake]
MTPVPHYWVVSRLTRRVVYLRPVVHFFPAYSLQARLLFGASSLLGCVVFGRVAGDSAAAYILKNYDDVTSRAAARVAGVVAQLGAQPETAKVREETPTSSGEVTSPPSPGRKSYAIDEVVKHHRNDIGSSSMGGHTSLPNFVERHPGLLSTSQYPSLDTAGAYHRHISWFATINRYFVVVASFLDKLIEVLECSFVTSGSGWKHTAFRVMEKFRTSPEECRGNFGASVSIRRRSKRLIRGVIILVGLASRIRPKSGEHSLPGDGWPEHEEAIHFGEIVGLPLMKSSHENIHKSVTVDVLKQRRQRSTAS